MHKNYDIKYKILNKYFEKIEKLKTTVIDKWINYTDVVTFFKTKEINFDTFMSNF